MSKHTIEMNFQKAKQQADKLDEIAADIKKLSNKDLQEVLGNVSSGWKGNNATLYLKKGETLGKNILQTANDLNNVASTIRQIAQRIYEAEMAAWRAAHRRSY